jgi:hypothetical protein
MLRPDRPSTSSTILPVSRLTRYTLNAVTVLSLLLCVGTVALYSQSKQTVHFSGTPFNRWYVVGNEFHYDRFALRKGDHGLTGPCDEAHGFYPVRRDCPLHA